MNAGNARFFLVGSVVTTALLFLGLRPIYLARLQHGATGSLVVGLVVCLSVVAGSFFLLRWAYAASIRTFMLVFVGGILGRLLLFGAAVAVAFVASGIDARGVAVAILVSFFPLTFLEVFCVVRGKRGGRPGAP